MSKNVQYTPINYDSRSGSYYTFILWLIPVTPEVKKRLHRLWKSFLFNIDGVLWWNNVILATWQFHFRSEVATGSRKYVSMIADYEFSLFWKFHNNPLISLAEKPSSMSITWSYSLASRTFWGLKIENLTRWIDRQTVYEHR